MYGYLQSDPSRLVLLKPVVPGSQDWLNGYRFIAHMFIDGEEHVYQVTAYDICSIVDVKEVLEGVW